MCSPLSIQYVLFTTKSMFALLALIQWSGALVAQIATKPIIQTSDAAFVFLTTHKRNNEMTSINRWDWNYTENGQLYWKGTHGTSSQCNNSLHSLMWQWWNFQWDKVDQVQSDLLQTAELLVKILTQKTLHILTLHVRYRLFIVTC